MPVLSPPISRDRLPTRVKCVEDPEWPRHGLKAQLTERERGAFDVAGPRSAQRNSLRLQDTYGHVDIVRSGFVETIVPGDKLVCCNDLNRHETNYALNYIYCQADTLGATLWEVP